MNATIITSQGRVIQEGDRRSGLIITDETGKVEVLKVDETSDDEIINLFLKPVGEASGVVPGELDRWWEVLVRRPPKAARRRKPSIGTPRKERGLAQEAREIKRLNRL